MQITPKIIKWAVSIVLAFIASIWLICENVGYKNSTEIVIKQSPFGTMSCSRSWARLTTNSRLQ